MSHTYTAEQIDWLRAHRKQLDQKALAQAFNAEFGTDLSVSKVRSACVRNKLYAARDHKSRAAPWNKGRSYTPSGNSRLTQFKPGNMPKNGLPKGALVRDPDGYWKVKISDRRDVPKQENWRYVHRLTWELANGEIPRGYIVVMLDGDKDNAADPDNLAAVSRGALAILNANAPWTSPDRDMVRLLIARAELRAAARRACDRLGMTVFQRRRALGAFY